MEIQTQIENTRIQMRKGIIELCVLSIIGRGETYASEILEHLKDAELIVVEGTLYPLLNRLKNAGLIHYRWEESVSGPPRKYYQLTENGKHALKDLKNTWNKLEIAVKKMG